MRIVSALIFIVSAFTAQAQQTPYRLSLSLPSATPMQLGERFYVQMELSVQKPYELDASSLPARARVGLHVQQDKTEVRSPWSWSEREYVLRIPYQVIGNSPSPSYVVVPPLVFNLRRAERSYPVVVESFSVNIAAGLTLAERNPGDVLPLRPTRAAPAMSAVSWQLGVFCSMMVLLALAGIALWRRFLWPWWLRLQRPFAKAKRALARMPNDTDETKKVRLVHAAMNASARETVMSCDLRKFLEKHPHFLCCERQLEAFFCHSDRAFFVDGHSDLQVFDFKSLMERCAESEARYYDV